MIEQELLAAEQALRGDNPAAALSELAAAARKKEERLQIDAQPALRETVRALLIHPEPKVRKNAARLLGALLHVEDGQALAGALANETTRFVVPSLLLALGSVGGEAAAAALDAYCPPEPQDATEEKHCREIADALKKARAAFATDEPLPVYTLTTPRPVLLVAPEGFAPLLQQELDALHIGYTPDARGALVTTAEPQKLFSIRCFTEALLPIGRKIALTPEAIAEAAGKELTLPYRLELRDYTEAAAQQNKLDRSALISNLVRALPGENNPSRYALELRIVCRGDKCDLFLKPSFADGRFAYRAQALPASIAPATAACLAALALQQKTYAPAVAEPATKSLPSGKARVLDPFCGSGTILFEVEKRLKKLGVPIGCLIGVDLAGQAVAAARANGQKAHSAAMIVHKDILRFSAREPFDWIVTNMPFGNRVGTHKSNELLYRAFTARLPELLAEDGVAVLYTMEYRLLSACLRRVPALRVVNQQRTEAGGLLPWVMIVQKVKASK